VPALGKYAHYVAPLDAIVIDLGVYNKPLNSAAFFSKEFAGRSRKTMDLCLPMQHASSKCE
jgi:hypothetical protein